MRLVVLVSFNQPVQSWLASYHNMGYKLVKPESRGNQVAFFQVHGQIPSGPWCVSRSVLGSGCRSMACHGNIIKQLKRLEVWGQTNHLLLIYFKYERLSKKMVNHRKVHTQFCISLGLHAWKHRHSPFPFFLYYHTNNQSII